MKQTSISIHAPRQKTSLQQYGKAIIVLLALAVSIVQVSHADINVACGDVSELVAAINTANSVGGDTISLASECTYGLTTVDNNGTNGANGLPVITSPITINGNDAAITRATELSFRIFEVANGGHLTFNNLTVSNGRADGNGNAGNGGGIFVGTGGILTFNSATAGTGAVNHNYAANNGGGIYIVQDGLVAVSLATRNSSVATDNRAGHDGGGIYISLNAAIAFQSVAFESSAATRNHAGHDGGGIYIAQGGLGSIHNVTLDGSLVTDNSADNNGGGLYIAENGAFTFQFATINGSTSTDNSAGNNGGGLYISGGGAFTLQTVTFNDSVISANEAGRDGGGLYIAGGGTFTLQAVTLNGSTINANEAGRDGGGIYIAGGGDVTLQFISISGSAIHGNRANQDGGGLYLERESTLSFQGVNLNSSAINGNRAIKNGGGLYNARGEVNFEDGSVNGNQAGPYGGGVFNLEGNVSFTNSRVNGNKSELDGGGIFNMGGSLTLTDSQVNGNKAGKKKSGITNTEGGTVTLINTDMEDTPQIIKNFTQVNQAGFGDPQINYSWSMAWFKGKLYVGTNKNILCAEAAAIDVFLPGYYGNALGPGISCAPTPQDLDLRAEIWGYDPRTKKWKRVFQSPQIPIPEHPGKSVALDIGFRGMAVFQEPDGSEALYVSGVSSGDFNVGVPPPRILRSTNGDTFSPLPQAPGTTLGDLDATGFRSIVTYTPQGASQPRLYILASAGLLGDGNILEAQNPAGGNNNFRRINPAGTNAFELTTFNGYLYLGGADLLNGYSVLKTNATGSPPYNFTTVIPPGGTGRGNEIAAAVSMQAFNGKLYIGANGWFPPQLNIVSELIRVNPDDSWELVVGNPRFTNQDLLFPLTGMGDGFFNVFNVHFWRMEVHKGVLYLGTNDSSVHFRETILEPFIRDEFGADLWASQNGTEWVRLTRSGFGDPFNFGIRALTSTDFGLFVGTASISVNTDTDDMGTEVWLGKDK
jgi:hypothetical protein